MCCVWEHPPSSLNPAAPSLQVIGLLDLGRGGAEDDYCSRFGNFDCQRDFNLSSAQLSTSLQRRKKGRAASMWHDRPSSGKMEFAEAYCGHFSIVSRENFFRPWKCSRKA